MKELNTLKEVVQAYKSGELTKEDSLKIDNDVLFIYKDDEKVFSIHPSDFIIEAAKLLKIPAEYV